MAFSLGAGPVPALLLPEIFGARIRAKAVSLSLGVHWVSSPFCLGLEFGVGMEVGFGHNVVLVINVYCSHIGR